MKYELTKLKNGVRVLTVPMLSLESATITVWVKTGSRFEDEKVNGISHFLEHMVFKGSPKYPSAKIVSETIDSMGAENNAGTSKEWTNFWIKTAVINIEKAFDILADTVLNPLLVQGEIDREREVIYQEIAMYEDTPIASIGENFEEIIYSGSPLGWKIAGTPKSLPNINKKEFEEYRSQKYHPENILVSAAGGITQEKVVELTEKYFSHLEEKKEKSELIPYRGTKPSISDRVFLKNKKTDQAHMVIGFLTAGRSYEGRFPQSILATILGRGMSSRLFTEVREKRGLAYSVRASFDRYIDVGTFDVYAGVHVGKIEETIKIIIDQLFGLTPKNYKIEKKEFDKAKSYMKGKLALSFEDSGNVSDFFAEQALFDKEILTPKDIYKKVDEVKMEEVYAEAAKLFKKEGTYLAIIGPYKDSKKFESLLTE